MEVAPPAYAVLPSRNDPYESMFETLYKSAEEAGRGGQPGYYIVSMMAWDYKGPLETQPDGRCELELQCTRADHPWIRAWQLQHAPKATDFWPHLIGRGSQGLLGCNRNPTGMVIHFSSPELREDFRDDFNHREHAAVRNISKYPITKAEKLAALDWAIERKTAEMNTPDAPVGGVGLAALHAARMDVEATSE